MALNFLSLHVYGGGPAHLFYNPAPVSCTVICALNAVTGVAGLMSTLYGNTGETSFGAEVPQYLVCISALNFWAAIYFARLTTVKGRIRSDEEWSRTFLYILLLNLLQYGSIIWGVWLCYRMVSSAGLVGTRMYYYLTQGKWMYRAVLAISVLNAYAIVLTTYTVLTQMLVGIVAQRGRRKFFV